MDKRVNLIEIADTPSKQEWGLQFVKKMEPDSAMLFDFKSPRVLSFWMKNTYIPLDIAFVDNGQIVKTERMIPMSLRTISSEKPCAMAIELPAGSLEKMGAKVGTRITVDRETKSVTFHE